jgi:RHS repeat-associated protein
VGALVYNYTYNALEQLVTRAQVSPATTTHFVHDRMGNVIAETAGGGATGTTGTTREYIYLDEAEIAPTMNSRTVVDRPLAVVSAVNTASPATYWVSVDHLNRPVKMTTTTKASVWDAIWQPWGGAHSLIVTGTAVFDARFPGQWFQSETGLHYNWHRSYDPTLGRYTQSDPLGFVDGPSVYGYAGGSPQRWVDRDGRLIFVPEPSLPPSEITPCMDTLCAKFPYLLGCFGPEMPKNTPNNVQNRELDISPSNFEKNLIDSGYTKSPTSSPNIFSFTKPDSPSFTTKPSSKSTNGPSVDVRAGGGTSTPITGKLRLSP